MVTVEVVVGEVAVVPQRVRATAPTGTGQGACTISPACRPPWTVEPLVQVRWCPVLVLVLEQVQVQVLVRPLVSPHSRHRCHGENGVWLRVSGVCWRGGGGGWGVGVGLGLGVGVGMMSVLGWGWGCGGLGAGGSGCVWVCGGD